MSNWPPSGTGASGAPRRGGPRWLLPVMLIGFIAIPLIEVYLLIQVGRTIGVLPTIGSVLVIAALGTWLAKHEGAKAWRGLNKAMSTGQLPQGELADAALVLVGAVLLIFPGFFTDLIGLFFLVPFTRPIAKKLFDLVLGARLKRMGVDPAMLRRRGPGAYGPGGFGAGQGETIEGETIDPEPERPRSPGRREGDIEGEIEP